MSKVLKDVRWKLGPAIVLLMIAAGITLKTHDQSWSAGIVWMGVFIVLVVLWTIYRAIKNQVVGTFRKMKRPEGQFVFSDDSFTVTTELGSITLPWTSVLEIRTLKDCWLFFFSRAQAITVPIAYASEDALAFIKTKLQKPEKQSPNFSS